MHDQLVRKGIDITRNQNEISPCDHRARHATARCVSHLNVASHQAGHAGRSARYEKRIYVQSVLLVQTAVLSQVPDGVATLQSTVRKSDFFLSPGRIQKAEAESNKYDAKPKFPWKPHDTSKKLYRFFFFEGVKFSTTTSKNQRRDCSIHFSAPERACRPPRGEPRSKRGLDVRLLGQPSGDRGSSRQPSLVGAVDIR